MLAVTGATGFLGAHLVCTLLEQGHAVLALKRESSSLVEFELISGQRLGGRKTDLLEKLRWEIADILDVNRLDEVFNGIDTVFHCAAVVSFSGSDSSHLMQNQIGTENVVNACLRSGVRKLIYASSTAAIGRTDSQLPVSELAQWYDDINNTKYAVSKHRAELEVWRGMEEGLDAVIVNPGIILGTGLWDKGSCRMFRKVYRGLRFYTEGSNGFVGVKDVSAIMSALAFGGVKNERFILVAENCSYRRLFNEMAQGFGRKLPDIQLKKEYLFILLPLFYVLGKLFPKANLSPETLRKSLNNFTYDNSKIKQAGFTFSPISEVIHESCREYLSLLSE